MNNLKLATVYRQGLIQPIGERRLEDIGSNFFKDQLSRYFFSFSREDLGVQKKLFTMHEFIHNMSQLVSANICHRMDNRSSYPLLESIRHLSVCCGNMQSVELKMFPCKKLNMQVVWLLVSSSLLEKFTIIRVLDLKTEALLNYQRQLSA